MRNVKAIFIKQILSFCKNPAMIGTPVAFLALPLAFILLIPGLSEDGGTYAITAQFTMLFVGISMVGTAGGLIAEDRATMNLRFMGMAGVKPYQYMLATCGALLVISVCMLSLLGLIGRHSGEAYLNFLIISVLGGATSMLLGVTLSLSKAAPFTPIVGLLLGMGPMFAEGNEFLARIFQFVYTYRINHTLREGLTESLAEPLQVILINLAVVLAAFIAANSMKKSLDS